MIIASAEKTGHAKEDSNNNADTSILIYIILTVLCCIKILVSDQWI
jgi:hypothetical protein